MTLRGWVKKWNMYSRPAQDGEKIQKQFLSQSKWKAASASDTRLSWIPRKPQFVFFQQSKTLSRNVAPQLHIRPCETMAEVLTKVTFAVKSGTEPEPSSWNSEILTFRLMRQHEMLWIRIFIRVTKVRKSDFEGPHLHICNFLKEFCSALAYLHFRNRLQKCGLKKFLSHPGQRTRDIDR